MQRRWSGDTWHASWGLRIRFHIGYTRILQALPPSSDRDLRSADILLPNDSSLCAPLIAFGTKSEKFLDRRKNLVRLVMLKPVSCAGYGFGAGPSEIACQSRRFAAAVQALVCVQQ